MSVHYTLKSPRQARALARLLSKKFPNPELAYLGLVELMMNAIEHGNLGLHNQKEDFFRKGRWLDEIETRLNTLPYDLKSVSVTFSENPRELKVTITDQGKGFNWQQFPNSLQDASRLHGRGIAISKLMSFDEVEYKGRGNQVICRVFRSENE